MEHARLDSGLALVRISRKPASRPPDLTGPELVATFVPAESKAEAAARIYSVAGARPEALGPGSTERKSALVALADLFDVPLAHSTKHQLAAKIAHRLDVAWTPGCYSAGQTITLLGLNSLLEGALDKLRSRPAPTGALGAEGADADRFTPARSKIEAVNRLSGLVNGGPEDLGPGSKERKRVLINVASYVDETIDVRLPKIKLGEALAATLVTRWDSRCWSRGETITLTGLNRILEGLERSLGRTGAQATSWIRDPRNECKVLLAALARGLQERLWDGRSSVEEMRSAEFAHWRQMEWPGFYTEFKGLPTLLDLGGRRSEQRYANTLFDYSYGSTWDLKCHSDTSASMILNAADAVRARVDNGPLGFLIVEGLPEYDESGGFDEWHRAFTREGARPRSTQSNSARSRRRKKAFYVRRFLGLVVENRQELASLVLNGTLTDSPQGRQPGGASRGNKYHLNLTRAARANVLIAFDA